MNLEQLMSKFILGKADNEEKEALEIWKKESEDNINILKETIRINELANKLEGYKQVDTTAAWEKVAARTNTEPKVFSINKWAKIAAMLLIFIASVAIFKYSTDTNKEENIAHTASSISVIKLNDGSIIDLDKDGQLVETASRSVSLQGRAYFDIAPDKNAPFTVKTNHGELTVLGTEFNIVTSSTSSQIFVTEGKVRHTYKGKEFILMAGDMIEITGNEVKKSSNINTQIDAWKKRSLTFTNESLTNVLNSVAVYYKVSISFQSGKTTDNCKINTSYTTEAIEDVLKELSIVAGLKYEFANNKIIVKSFKC